MIWDRHYRLAGPKTPLKVQKPLIFFMRAEGARKFLGVLRRGVPGGSRSNRDFRGGPGLGGSGSTQGGFRGHGERVLAISPSKRPFLKAKSIHFRYRSI